MNQGASHPLCCVRHTSQPSIQGAVGLVQRFGKFYKSVDPGLVQINVCTESLRIVDVKIQISPIGRQKVITRDNVDVEMYVPTLLHPLSNRQSMSGHIHRALLHATRALDLLLAQQNYAGAGEVSYRHRLS